MLQVKDDIELKDLTMLDPRVLIVLGHFTVFAEKRGLPVVITSIISDRKNVQAVSKTHEDGRAVDVSSRNWPKKRIRECVEYISQIVGHYGAISYSDFERRVIIHHSFRGQGDHFHIQVSR